jgi:guanylate kinase
MEELGKLQKSRESIRDQNLKYVERHPELKTLMDEFATAVVAEKPSDIIKFGAKWFATLRSGGVGFPPLILTGPSGCGKSTFVEMLMKDYPHLFTKCIETTTRIQKDSEVDGRDFHFVDEMQFDEMKEAGKFVHWWPVMQNFYGITVDAVEEVYDEKKICIVDCEVENVAEWRNSVLDCKYFFLTPPSMEALEQRLQKSQKYNKIQIDERMEAAVAQMDEGTTEGKFDQVVYNDNLARSYIELVRSVSSWYMSADIEAPPMPSDDESGSGTSGGGAGEAKSQKSGKSRPGSRASSKK